MKAFLGSVKKIFPNENDQPEVRNFKIIIYSIIGIIILTVVAGLGAFFLSLQAGEQTLVPSVNGLDLEDALLELQEKELNPRIQLRYSSDPNLKGKVLDQDPEAGTLVKAGRIINLTISQGAIVDTVENYIGKNIDEVRVRIQTLFTTYKPLLQIGDLVYVFDESDPGTILEQSPEPGTELTGLTELEFVVSRGPDVERFSLPAFIGINYEQAVDLLAEQNIPFQFDLAGEDATAANPGYIVSQSPEAGTDIVPGEIVRLEMVPPQLLPEDHVFGIFERVLPDYPVLVDMRFDSIGPDGERETYFSMKHPGGKIAIPYVAEPNTTLILLIEGREVIRYIVPSPPSEEE